jgi:hypothetical protein
LGGSVGINGVVDGLVCSVLALLDVTFCVEVDGLVCSVLELLDVAFCVEVDVPVEIVIVIVDEFGL